MVILSPRSKARTAATTDYIRKNLARKITLEELAANVSISKYHFCRRFKRATGMTATAYIASVRVEEAKRRLDQGESIARVTIACGYSNQSHLTRSFKKLTGKTPAQYQREVFNPPE